MIGGGGGLVAKSCSALATPWTTGHQAPLSMGFPKQGYRNGFPFPSPGDLPDPGTELASPALQVDCLRWATRESHLNIFNANLL